MLAGGAVKTKTLGRIAFVLYSLGAISCASNGLTPEEIGAGGRWVLAYTAISDTSWSSDPLAPTATETGVLSKGAKVCFNVEPSELRDSSWQEALVANNTVKFVQPSRFQKSTEQCPFRNETSVSKD
jgi:hypothetical protein